ncbi:hypothetical protein IAQ61_011049 [Plenodomus lingam]|uniref:uncharacterized protein n=1 Tax=Leptosphaeria maculans TaxID=5022 RepID=UPI0033212FD7|nr:hypothetical protein IAQ61_011049 [Plenodomus lingam]
MESICGPPNRAFGAEEHQDSFGIPGRIQGQRPMAIQYQRDGGHDNSQGCQGCVDLVAGYAIWTDWLADGWGGEGGGSQTVRVGTQVAKSQCPARGKGDALPFVVNLTTSLAGGHCQPRKNPGKLDERCSLHAWPWSWWPAITLEATLLAGIVFTTPWPHLNPSSLMLFSLLTHTHDLASHLQWLAAVRSQMAQSITTVPMYKHAWL